jgi:hypothetical protein
VLPFPLQLLFHTMFALVDTERVTVEQGRKRLQVFL